MTNQLTRFEIAAIFKQMRILHPRVDAITKACEGARRASRIGPLEPKGFMELFAPSGSGKSHAVKIYIEKTVVPDVIAQGLFPAEMDRVEIARRQVKVLHVTLNEKANRENLYADILTRLGAPVKSTANIGTLRRQLYSYLRGENDPINNPDKQRPCELLILDEIQHLSQGAVRHSKDKSTKEYETIGTDVSDALKFMMIEGMVPVLFVGIPEASMHLRVDPQLRSRHNEAIAFEPLRWSLDTDAKVFSDYCVKVGITAQKVGLLPEVTNLGLHGIPHMLWAASGGLIGLATRLIEEAVFHTLEAGKTQIGILELAQAVDTRGIPQGYCNYNPFREGIIKPKAGKA